MKATGYEIKEAIRKWELRRDGALHAFEDSLSKFENETKEHPDVLSARFLEAETTIAILQTAQVMYNLNVSVAVLDYSMTLCQAVKQVGGAGRHEKLWKIVAVGRKKSKYEIASNPTKVTRSKEEEQAVQVVTPTEAIKRAAKASEWAGALRAAIAEGNSTVVEIGILKTSYFE